MDKRIIIKGKFQQIPDYNGRIYDENIFNKLIEDYKLKLVKKKFFSLFKKYK